MRVYVPIIVSELGQSAIAPRMVHAVTPDLQRAVPGEDEESYEMIATLAAADDSLRLIQEAGSDVRVRALVVADVRGSGLEIPKASPDLLPTSIRMLEPLAWDRVESIHIDEEGSEDIVDRAIDGDEKAFLDSGDIELMWFDVTEREQLAEQFSA